MKSTGILQKFNNMNLSIYVNLRSIAWVVTEEKEVIAKGIKRVMVEYDNYYEFIAGLPVSKRANRRGKRTARRNLWRYKSRRQRLKKYLSKIGMIQDKEYSLSEMLKLRVKALSEKLQPNELAAVFLSLQKKRGYKNMRGLANAETSDYLATIKNHEDNLKNYRTIAEYLLHNFESAKNIIFTRESYEAEFSAICKAQGIEDERLFGLIYFQRPLSRGKIATCPLEKKRKVCHYSHPDYQYFRILRDVNNIFIQDSNFNDIDITQDIRNKWVEKLMSGQNLTKAACCKDLGIKKSTGYVWKSGKQIQGNILSVIGNNYELWEDLFSATDDAKLTKLLEQKYPEHNTEELLDINFNSAGWGEYSHKAIMKLIPYLKSGMTLKEAILQCYGVVDMTDSLSLRNLIVEQHYDSYVSLINAVKLKYQITETAIEISHLLKAGNKSRKEMSKTKRKENKRDNTFTDYQYALLSLYEEFGKRSPYEPHKEISIEELFDNYNIDHIVPKSKLFEHGKINQCLCRKDLNEQKGSMTGIEFARHLGIEDEYRKFVDNAKISEQKKRFMLMEVADIPSDYIGSEDYITRCFATKANYVIPNKLINKYYRDWGWNTYPENDVRNTLMRAYIIANFDTNTINYFNKLKDMPNQNIGRYDIKAEVVPDNDMPIPYVPRIKFYRPTKYGKIPRFQLHEESILGKRKEITRNTKGEIVCESYYKIRKQIASLTPAMIDKIIDVGLRNKIKAFFEGKSHEDAIKEITENPLKHNGKPIKSVSIRINANNLIKLDRGYVYSAMHHRVDFTTMKAVTLHQYILDINAGKTYTGKCLKRNDVIEYNGQYYFIVGAKESSDLNLRSVYELNAISVKGNKNILQKSKIVRINQLGKVKYDA